MRAGIAGQKNRDHAHDGPRSPQVPSRRPAALCFGPRIGLAALLKTQAGKGSGVLNSCSFLGGTVGVTGGGIVFGLAGFGGVLVLVGLSALVGGCLSMRLRAV